MTLPFQPLLEPGFLSAHAQPTLCVGDFELRPSEHADGPGVVEAARALSGRLCSGTSLAVAEAPGPI